MCFKVNLCRNFAPLINKIEKMKKIIKNSLFIAMLFSAIVTMASESDNSINFTVVNSNLIDLNLENFDGEIKVSVKDAHGEVLHSEKLSGTSISKTYDLKTLPSGDYLFEIEGETKIKKLPFSVNRDGIVLDEVRTVCFKPAVRVENELIYISQLVMNEEALSIALLDNDANVLYEGISRNSEFTGKILSTEKLEEGSYTLVMESGGRTFNEVITVEK